MMVTENKKGTAFRMFALGTIFMLGLFLMFGCTSQQQTGAPQDNAMDKSNAPVETTKIDNAQNKTGFEQTQETIALAIADGTYVEKVSYDYHSGTEIIEVSVSVENDVITSASIKSAGGNMHNYSVKLITAVNAELPALVVGKKITELEIPKNVAGSSLTTAAFKRQLEVLVQKY